MLDEDEDQEQPTTSVKLALLRVGTSYNKLFIIFGWFFMINELF